MNKMPAWIRVVLFALSLVLIGLGLLLAWIAWSIVSGGILRSSRQPWLQIERADDPAVFWLFVSIEVAFAAGVIVAGGRLCLETIRGKGRRLG